MENVAMRVEESGNTLTIKIDLNKDLGLSKSGKSRKIASSGGNVKIPGTDAVIGINVYRKA
jgi:hypothetical protein